MYSIPFIGKNSEKGGGRLTDEIRKKQAAEQIWLAYFNRVLFEKGIITESERNKMALKIESRRPPAAVKKKTEPVR